MSMSGSNNYEASDDQCYVNELKKEENNAPQCPGQLDTNTLDQCHFETINQSIQKDLRRQERIAAPSPITAMSASEENKMIESFCGDRNFDAEVDRFIGILPLGQETNSNESMTNHYKKVTEWNENKKIDDLNDSIFRTSVNCPQCRRKLVALKALRSRQVAAEKRTKCLREETDVLLNSISLKDILLEELNSQLKTLVNENLSIQNKNEELSIETLKNEGLSEELNTCLAKNEELSSALSELTTSYQNTCEELDEISRNYKDMVLEKDDLRARLDTSLDDASKCKANSNSMMKEMEGAHKQMDDIMYTLSLQGYTSVRDSTGNTIELKHLSGDSHFENEDCISESEYKQNIQEKDEKIAKLKAKCKLLEDNNSNLPAEENGNTINDLTDTVNNLRDQLLQIKISEINITDELEKEKKEKDELLKSHEQYKVVLCDRISNLKLALNSSKESKSCKPIEDRAARKLRHANARRQRRRECVTSTENNTGVECQGDQPTITETNDKLEGQEVDFENNRLDV